jgi:hypothetical protein
MIPSLSPEQRTPNRFVGFIHIHNTPVTRVMTAFSNSTLFIGTIYEPQVLCFTQQFESSGRVSVLLVIIYFPLSSLIAVDHLRPHPDDTLRDLADTVPVVKILITEWIGPVINPLRASGIIRKTGKNNDGSDDAEQQRLFFAGHDFSPFF